MGKRVAITGLGVSLKPAPSENEKAFKNRKIKKLLSRGEKIFCRSAVDAVLDSGILETDTANEKRGIFLGTTKESSSRTELLNVLKSIYDGEIRHKEFAEAVAENMSPLFVIKSLPNACLHYAAEEFGIRGSNSLFITNGAAGSQAIAAAYHTILRGDCIWCLAGGFDSHLDEEEAYNFKQYGFKVDTIGEEKSSEGLGEGAGTFILEDYDHAVSRKAKIYGEIIGHGETFLDLDQEETENIRVLKKGICKSLASAHEDVTNVAFIHADGLTYKNYNVIEEAAIKDIFHDIPQINSKNQIGNLLGAAPMVEIAEDLSGKEIDQNRSQVFMKLSAGFGGEVSIIVLRRNGL
ncbi:beta-ketoacyl synthase N-terminal-like domain-containing protein [Lacrimispora sp.]|uniref:beta-ketoacyl synthase N-terminal-like domain-containing protein n=1 Tax=Lacrimispora sp. TaxID=2719234 RepID=UPI0028B1DD98|nr:beta-ketoacyl synthase N-terminal-like domain-containing protein [Lacrimispora sp.]